MNKSNLLHQIQTELVESSHDLTNTLRKALILSNRLSSEPLKCWVNSELRGYTNQAHMPDYRKVSTRSFTDYIQGRTSYVRMPVPLHIEYGMHSKVSLSISGLLYEIDRASNNPNFIFQEEWSPDMFDGFKDVMGTQVFVKRVWKEISINQLVQIIDAVKSKLLDFVMELESYADASGKEVGSISTDFANEIFYKIILNNPQFNDIAGDMVGGDKIGENKIN